MTQSDIDKETQALKTNCHDVAKDLIEKTSPDQPLAESLGDYIFEVIKGVSMDSAKLQDAGDIALEKLKVSNEENKDLKVSLRLMRNELDRSAVSGVNQQLQDDLDASIEDHNTDKLIMKDLVNDGRDLRAKNTNLEDELYRYKRQCERLETEGCALVEKVRKLAKTNQEFRDEMKRLEKVNHELRKEKNALQSESADFIQSIKTRDEKIVELQAIIQKDVDSTQKLIADMSAIGKDGKKLNEFDREVQKSLGEALVEQHEEELEQCRTEINDLQTQNQTLEETIRELRGVSHE